MPLDSSDGKHQLKSFPSYSAFRIFPGLSAIGNRWNGTSAALAPIENLVSILASPDVSICPTFGYQSLGGSFITRRCAYSNNMMTPYISASGGYIHKVEYYADGVALSDGTSGYVAVMNSSRLWYARKQVRYHAFAYYLLQVYCYGDFFIPASDAFVYRITTSGVAHDAPQTSTGYILKQETSGSLKTYTTLLKTNSDYLIDSSQPQSYREICQNLSAIHMPRLKFITIPDGCLVQVRSFGFYLTPFDSPDYGT